MKPPLLKSLKLKEIEIAELQARAATDDKTIAEYAEAYQDGTKFPPAVVFHDGKKYFLADGFHRYFGADRAGLADILCDVRQGTRSDALWFSIGANKTHGLKRSNADKRNAVELALSEKPALSERAIAEHVGVSHTFVANLKKDISTSVKEVATLPPPTTKLPPVPVVKSEPEKPQSIPVPPTPKPPVVIPPTRIEDKTGYGRAIPKAILPLWERSHEVQEILTSISRIRSAVRKAQDEKDKLFLRVNFSSVLANFDQSYADLKTAIPFAVCTVCQGNADNGCGLCKGSGFISEFLWNTAVTAETKQLLSKVKK